MTYSTAQLEQARRLGTSTLFEASGLATSAADSAIRPVWAGASIAGPAYPLECSPGDNLAIHIAMEKAPRGSILVVSTGGFVAGYWGEVLTVAAEAAGIAGLVIDGGVRDVKTLQEMGFPVWSKAVSSKGCIKATLGSVNIPIVCAGMLVSPGDVIVADDDGIVCVPRDQAAATLDAAQKREANEAGKRDIFASGVLGLDYYKMREGLAKAGLRYID